MNAELKRQLKKLDEQEDRIYLFADERQAMIGMRAVLQTLPEIVPQLERLAKHQDKRTWRKLKGGYQLMRQAVIECCKSISYLQHDSITQNSGFVRFVLAKNDGMVNMRVKDFSRLVLAARLGACGKSCMMCMSINEWKNCQLQQLLSTVPCSEGKNDRIQLLEGICPFALADPHEFDKVEV